jgi:hypothetical protein
MLLSNSYYESFVASYIKTATDVLRLAVSWSEGDISLAGSVKFKSFKNKDRRFLMGLLENVNSPLEDMKRHRTKWLRLGEKLHPSAKKKQFPRTASFFDKLRNSNKDIKTFNSLIEKLLVEDPVKASRELMKRPGEFGRRLNDLCSRTLSMDIVMNFMEVAKDVPTTMLMELNTYFSKRTARPEEDALRVFFPKGQTSKAQAVKDERQPLDPLRVSLLTTGIRDILLERFKSLDPMGAVYIDPELKNHNIPFGIRSASEGLKTLARGSRVSVNTDANIIRFFSWWRDCSNRDRVDIDLSAVIYNDKWEYDQHLSYTQLKGKGINSCHSGDITSAPNGACEFIDIDMDSVVASGSRYVVMEVYSYSHQKFSDIPECSAGWMERTDMNSGEIFDAKTVENRFDLTSNVETGVPLVIDCKTKQVIWFDIGVSRGAYCNNVENNLSTVSLISKSITEMNKPTMYDLLSLHANARGNVVETPEEADIICDLASGLAPEDYPFLV